MVFVATNILFHWPGNDSLDVTAMTELGVPCFLIFLTYRVYIILKRSSVFTCSLLTEPVW